MQAKTFNIYKQFYRIISRALWNEGYDWNARRTEDDSSIRMMLTFETPGPNVPAHGVFFKLAEHAWLLFSWFHENFPAVC